MKTKKIIKRTVKEITPVQFSCIAAACPSVFETEEGALLIIGKKLNIDNVSEEVKKKIGSNETVIEVPINLIMDLFKE